MMKLYILIFGIVTSTLAAHLNTFEENTNKTGLFLHIKNISCPFNEEVMEDVICTLTPEDQKLGRLHFAGTLKKTIHLMWLGVSIFNRNGSDDFEFSHAAFGDDMCTVANYEGESQMFSLMSGLYEKVKHMIHPCPYNAGRYEVPEYVQDMVRYSDITIPLQLQDYKFVFRLHDEHNRTFVEMSVIICFDY